MKEREKYRRRTPSKAKTEECRYGSNCFTCPMRDCTINGVYVNALPTDFIYLGDIRSGEVVTG